MDAKGKRAIYKDNLVVVVNANRDRYFDKNVSWSVDPDWDAMDNISIKDFLR